MEKYVAEDVAEVMNRAAAELTAPPTKGPITEIKKKTGSKPTKPVKPNPQDVSEDTAGGR